MMCRILEKGRVAVAPKWYTPAENIAAARAVLGAIDLDPASKRHGECGRACWPAFRMIFVGQLSGT